MKDDQKLTAEGSEQKPQMLAMHKKMAKTSDGTRELIFYTFTATSNE